MTTSTSRLPIEDFDALWRRTQAALRGQMSPYLYASWIEPLRLASASETRIALTCPTAFLRDYAAGRFGERIANLMAELSGRSRPIDFVFEPVAHLSVVSTPRETKDGEVAPLDFDMRFALLQAKAQMLRKTQPGLAIGDDVLRMIAARVSADAAVLESALLRIAERSAGRAEPVTLSSAQVWLGDFLRMHDRRITVDQVKRSVMRRYALKPGDLESKCRRREIVHPRQLAMYVTRTLTGKSFPDIGRHFKRDHTTVLHGYEKVLRLLDTHPEIAAELEEIKRDLRD